MKFKFSILPLVLIGLVIGIYLILNTGRRAVERLVPDAIEVSDEAGGDQNLSLLEDPNRSVRPAIFRSVTERDNLLVLRGTAEPDVVVSILGNGERRRQVRADGDGIWDAEIDVSIDRVLALSLTTFLGENIQINGDEMLLRIVPPAVDTDADEASRQPQAGGDLLPLGLSRPLILLTAPGGPSRVIQTPFGFLPSREALTLNAVEYDDLGGVIFSGFSSRAGRVRIFGNSELIGESRVGTNGRWFLIAAETLPVTDYNLRVQLQEPDGVEENIEINLRRLRPGQNADVSPYVVFNDTVWHIRRNLAGGGVQYTAILSPESVVPTAVTEEE